MKRSPLAASPLAVLLFALSVLPSCRTWTTQYFVGSEDYELARVTASDGAVEIFRLQGADTLRVETRYERERPFLGLQVVELDKPRAERRGVKPYSGLLVTGTYPESAARLAGVRADDVVLDVGGAEVVYAEQLVQAEAGLDEQETVLVRLVRGDEEIALALRTQLLREDVTDVQQIPLEPAPASPRPYAGVTLRGIPPAWCERMFGEPRNAVVVSTVEVGSPAWLAGVRGGDLIETVDGEPVPRVDELARAIAANGQIEQPMTWLVRREEGRTHEAVIALSDYSGEANFFVPLLVDVTNGVYEDRWRLGLGLIMGNRNLYVADASTRRVQTRNVFSALLGLIKVDARPTETRVRLLWFIKFDT